MSSSPELVLGYVPGVVREVAPSGFVEGFAGGYTEGLRIATSSAAAETLLATRQRERLAAEHGALLRQAVASLHEAADALRAERQQAAAELTDLVSVCVADLTNAVVLAAAPSATALRARLERALGDLDLGTPVEVRVAPGGQDLLAEAGMDTDRDLRLVPDSTLGAGDVVVTAGAATVTDILSEAVARVVARLSSDGTS